MTETAFDRTTLWIIIGSLAIGSYAIRFLFIGFVGNKSMPEWIMRHLRYTGVAIVPAIAAPLTLWPTPTGGEVHPVYLAAGILTFAIAALSKNVLVAMATGAATLYGLLYLFN